MSTHPGRKYANMNGRAAKDTCPSRLINSDPGAYSMYSDYWICDQPVGHKGNHSARDRITRNVLTWSDKEAIKPVNRPPQSVKLTDEEIVTLAEGKFDPLIEVYRSAAVAKRRAHNNEKFAAKALADMLGITEEEVRRVWG